MTYLATSNKATDVSIDITRETEVPIVVLSLGHSSAQQLTTTMISDNDLDLGDFNCDMFHDNDDTRYNLLVVNNGTIIYNSFNNYSNYSDDGKYSFANIRLNSSSVNYTIYGYTEHIREYQLMTDTELIKIYYKINDGFMRLDEYTSTLFQNIKETCDNFANGHEKKNAIYIIEFYSFSHMNWNHYDIL